MAGELETGTPCGVPVSGRELAGLRYVASLLAFGAIDDLEFDRLTFLERPEPIALDCREVDEHVRPAVTFNETVTLGVVEPLPYVHRPFPPELRCDDILGAALTDTKKDRECAASTYDSWPPSQPSY
jgi:hypothetical protein